MAKFLKILALFFAPLFLLCALFFAVLLRSGELTSTQDAVVQTLNGTLVQFGLGYRDNTRTYKQQVAAGKKAELLVLGTSRSMQLHSAFFSNYEGTFYNAGGGAAYLQQVLPFLESLPQDALPERLILVLDQYFFNDGWAQAIPGVETVEYDWLSADFRYAYRRVFTDYGEGRYALSTVLQNKSGVIGIAAAARGAGFYPDGAYSYGKAVLTPEKSYDWQFADTYDRIAKSTNRFEQSDTVSPEMLALMDEILAFCATKGIAVTGVIPPYAPSVWLHMMENGNYGYMAALGEALAAVFAPYGGTVVDCSYLPETTDNQYIDGFHGSDRVYAAVCLRLAQTDALADCFDTDYLTALFTAEGNPLCVEFTAYA